MLILLKRLFVGVNVLACISCIGLAFNFLILPNLAKYWYGTEYKEKMYVCDNAMREHLIAKNRVKYEKSSGSLDKLKIAEIGLVHCHDYDMLRKKLISLGLSKNDLAKLGLEAIEEKVADLDRLVEIHEFKF